MDSYTSKLLKGLPFVAGYGLQVDRAVSVGLPYPIALQGAAQPPKSGTYKLPKAIKVDTRSRRNDHFGSQQYYSQDCQDTNATNQLSSSESYCLQTVGNEYRGVKIGVLHSSLAF